MARRGAHLVRLGALLLGAPVALAGCRAAPDGKTTLQTRAAETSVAAPPEYSNHPRIEARPSASTGLPALQAEWLLPLGGEQDGVVAPAVGATAARPIVVGVHGAGDRPEWSCGGWRMASQVSSFVVCPRGAAMTAQTFAWSSSQQLGERVDNAVRRTGELFGAYVAAGPMIYAGFSQGATLAEPFLRKHAARFPIVILAEGGYQTASNPAFARAFRAAGGRRVVLVCGSSACFQRARLSQTVLERAGVEVLVVGDPLAGHNLNERMQQALQSAWPRISAPVP
jgi:predicted esterase